MAKSKNNAKKLSYISVPSQIINSLSSSSLQSLLISPKKSSRNNNRFFSFFNTSYRSPRFWFFFLFLFGLFGMLKLGFNLDPLVPSSSYPCVTGQSQGLSSIGYSKSREMDVAINGGDGHKNGVLTKFRLSETLTRKGYSKSEKTIEKNEFWKQPDGLGYKPCLAFTREYRRESEGIVNDRRKYLMVVVSGGMNQQRNQIVDAVIIARILGAALVVPVLQVNVIWGDER